MNKYRVNNKLVFETVLLGISQTHSIDTFIGDNPKRSFARNALCHSGKYSCEYCFNHGVPLRSITESAASDITVIEQKIMKLQESDGENTETINLLLENISLLKKNSNQYCMAFHICKR